MDRRTRIVDELRDIVAQLSAGALAPAAVEPTAPLFDFGYVDSLTAVMLIERIQTRWDVEISEVDLVGRCHTLDALAGFIATRVERSG